MESESPTQYERDLRGANQESKRHKDHAIKWRNGRSYFRGEGCWPMKVWDGLGPDPWGTEGDGSLRGKVLPMVQAYSAPPWRQHNNINKLNKSELVGNSQLVGRGKQFIHEELEATRDGDIPGSDLPCPGLDNDGFLYSFDRSDTPGRPLSLDVFIKAPTARDTEKLVEKEYEVVDENGQALKGREAKRNLRKSGSHLAAEKAADDGFELV